MSYQWDWQFFLQDTGGGETYLQWMMSAWGWTLAVSAAAWCVALIAGVVIGVLRTLSHPRWQRLGQAWVELFRNIPVLVQLFLWYFVIPEIIPWMKQLPSFVLVVFALGSFTSARIAEQVRSGIQSLPKGQSMASEALGLTTWQTYRYILLPITLRIIFPPLTSEAMNVVKNSSVAFAVSVPELTLFARQAQEETSRGIEVYLAVTLLYMATAFAVNRLMVWLERRTTIVGMTAGSDTPC